MSRRHSELPDKIVVEMRQQFGILLVVRYIRGNAVVDKLIVACDSLSVVDFNLAFKRGRKYKRGSKQLRP